VKIGNLVHDYALGKNGIVISGSWIEEAQPYDSNPVGREIPWEWLVLYEDGEAMGADTGDLQEIKNESR